MTVLFNHVPEYLLTAVFVEVNVYVRHRDAVRVEESFEEEIILYGINVSDPERIGYGTTGSRSPARTDPYAHPAGSLQEILHYQEVAGEAHVFDY